MIFILEQFFLLILKEFVYQNTATGYYEKCMLEYQMQSGKPLPLTIAFCKDQWPSRWK